MERNNTFSKPGYAKSSGAISGSVQDLDMQEAYINQRGTMERNRDTETAPIPYVDRIVQGQERLDTHVNEVADIITSHVTRLLSTGDDHVAPLEKEMKIGNIFEHVLNQQKIMHTKLDYIMHMIRKLENV